MTINELNDYLINLFEADKRESFPGEFGLTIKGRPTVNRVGYATNLTMETIEAAEKNNVDLILTHHDAWELIFGLKEVCTKRLTELGISHFFAHALLDDADFGTNVALMERLGATVIEKSNPYQGLLYAGRVGEFIEPIPFTDLVKRVETLLEEPVRSWQNRPGPVQKLCVVTGGGFMTDEIHDAVERGCDTYITGEKMLYSIEYAAFAGINLIVGSHTFTEVFGVENLAQKVGSAFPSLEIVRLPESHIE
ncbi:MAG: Nif3-like dinuclear metal center hexameric protein [Chitinophagales bacterium]